jgi:EmrB/QacA subfamily drug resistance transporter
VRTVQRPHRTARRGIVLAVLCLCSFLVNMDTTIVNVTLPTLVRELGATTRDLQWIVDAYNLTFAAFVLAAGSLGDRWGRQGMLLAGLGLYGVANGVAALAGDPGELIAARTVTGVAAAMIFPTTLSIITNVFPERGARAKAIGVWGAVTGLAVALGPIVGGGLLEIFSWQSTFLVKLPVALAALLLVLVFVPTSRDETRPGLDLPGLALSTLAVGLLVFTIIEAPKAGWDSARSLGGFAGSALLLTAFVAWERRTSHPMLDVRLFRNLRFSGASVAVTFAFFALFGFIFLITQYFQFLKGYGPFETGLRIIPVATMVGVGSVLGTRLAVSRGNKVVVASGLGLLAIAFAWIATTADSATPYVEIAGQMIPLGLGMGLTSAPATESIMGAVDRDKAGIGSAVNDATRELGGTLGVAVIGSVYASLYVDALVKLPAAVPAKVTAAAHDSIGGALIASHRLAAAGQTGAARAVRDVASSGFFDGMHAGCLVAAGVCAAGALFAALVLPARPAEDPLPAVT